MNSIHRRHDISDKVWALLDIFQVVRAHGAALQRQPFVYQCCFLDFAHGGAPWRDLPPIWAGGRTRTAVLSGGGMPGFGKSCWKS